MKQVQKEAIKNFFIAVQVLKDTGVIRSDKYLGDISEAICAGLYDLQLAKCGRQVGFDGTSPSGAKVQIKFHGSTTRTNINLGNPDNYDECLVVLGVGSLLRSTGGPSDDFLIYRFDQSLIKTMNKTYSGSYSCGKSYFEGYPDKVFNICT